MRVNFLLTGVTNPTSGSFGLNSSTGAFNSNQSSVNMFGNLKPSGTNNGGFENSRNSPFVNSNSNSSNNGLTFN